MILTVQRHVHDAIAAAIRRQFGLAEVPHFAVEVPPNRALGDLAVPVAFQLARTLRKAPRAIAQELAQALGDIPGVARIVAGAERLSESVSRSRRVLPAARAAAGAAGDRRGGKDDRRAHGHQSRTRRRTSVTCGTRRSATRSCACCASAARRSKCRTTSTTSASRSPTSSSASGSSNIARSTRSARSPTRRDSTTTAGICTRASPNGTTKTPRASQVRARALHDLEHGGNDAAAMAAFIVERIVRAHLKTMARLNIGYDLLTYEGDILRLQFWAHAFEILKAQGAVFLQTEGKLAGCWVMRIEEDTPARPPSRRRRPSRSGRRGGQPREGHRPLERRRHLRRQGHREPVLEVRAARPRLPVPPVRDAGRRAAAVVDDIGRRRAGRAAVRPGGAHLQRHRLAADVPAGAAQPGAADARSPAGGGELDPFLVRDGRAVARDRARARLRDGRRERRGRRSRSSRCRDARGSASRSTTCSTC